jgi:hypothetical protein
MAEIDRSQLVDIKTIRINTSLPADQRMERYLEQIRNPYCFLCGDSVVRLRFAEGGGELKSKLKNYFISTKRA